MEYGVGKLKVVVAGVMAALFFVVVIAMPALAQDDSPPDVQYGDNIEIGDITTQFCQNILNINVTNEQYNAGDQVAIGDGNAQEIAQEQNVPVNVVQTCFNLIGDNNVVGGGGGVPNGETTETVVEKGGEKIVMSAELPTVLAKTGGEAMIVETTSAGYRVATLIPVGVLLVVFGAVTFSLRSWRR